MLGSRNSFQKCVTIPYVDSAQACLASHHFIRSFANPNTSSSTYTHTRLFRLKETAQSHFWVPTVAPSKLQILSKLPSWAIVRDSNTRDVSIVSVESCSGWRYVSIDTPLATIDRVLAQLLIGKVAILVPSNMWLRVAFSMLQWLLYEP